MPEDFYLSQLNGVSWTWRRQCRHKSLLLRKTHGDGIAGSIASDGYRVGKACGQSGRSRAVGTCPARYGYCLSAGDVHHGIHGCRHRSGRTDGGAFGGVDALYGSRNGYRPGRKPYHRRRQRTALQPVRVRLSGRAYRLVRQTAPFFVQRRRYAVCSRMRQGRIGIQGFPYPADGVLRPSFPRVEPRSVGL